METSVNIFPLFSSPLAALKIDGDFSKIKKSVTKTKYRKTIATDAPGSQISENLNILDNFPEEKQLLMDTWNGYNKNFLGYTTTDFQITTSWITKTAPDGHSQFHNHRNSFYSAVLYFDDILGGNIEFDSMGVLPKQLLVNDPIDWTIYNCNSFTYTPEKNVVLFFPSYLYHRVTTNTSGKNRYSLAFNLFPINQFGEGDSSVNIKLV